MQVCAANQILGTLVPLICFLHYCKVSVPCLMHAYDVYADITIYMYKRNKKGSCNACLHNYILHLYVIGEDSKETKSHLGNYVSKNCFSVF